MCGLFCVYLRRPNQTDMKRFYKTAAVAIVLMIALVSCKNAGAQNDKKADARNAAVKELTIALFNTMIYDMTAEDLKYLGDKPAIVDFTATWCGPCQRIAPILDELAKEYTDKIAVYKVDIDKNRELAKAFNVSSIPAILYIPLNGEPVMTIGSRDKGKFQNEIETILLGN